MEKILQECQEILRETIEIQKEIKFKIITIRYPERQKDSHLHPINFVNDDNFSWTVY